MGKVDRLLLRSDFFVDPRKRPTKKRPACRSGQRRFARGKMSLRIRFCEAKSNELNFILKICTGSTSTR